MGLFGPKTIDDPDLGTLTRERKTRSWQGVRDTSLGTILFVVSPVRGRPKDADLDIIKHGFVELEELHERALAFIAEREQLAAYGQPILERLLADLDELRLGLGYTFEGSQDHAVDVDFVGTNPVELIFW